MFVLSPSTFGKDPRTLKILFVGVNEEDTAFLTKDTPLNVVCRSSSATQDLHLEKEKFDALVVDVAHSATEDIRTLKKSAGAAVFMLADSVEVPKAVQFVKEGADGFLVRGITNPSSFVELAKLAKRRT